MRSRLLLAALGLLLGVVVAEGVARLIVRTDGDGQRWLGQARLLPHRLPLAQLRRRAVQLEDPSAVVAYDPDLGWSPRPNARSKDGRVAIDGRGARRTGADHDDGLRIVTVGDSFTFGDEVADDETWPAYLEAELNASGEDRPVDVVNLGTNGYGVDQAALRFERDGRPLSPEIVVLGLQPENLLRNLNVVRAVYFPETSLPLSKPRFLVDENRVRIVNQPAAPVSEVLGALDRPLSAPLLRHEGWLDERYVPTPLQVSVLFSLVQSFLAQDARGDPYDVSPEVSRVAWAILDRLESAVRSAGGRLVIVHLPRRDELRTILEGRTPWYADWLDEVASRYEVVRPEEDLASLDESFFRPGGHYAPLHNARVADAVARHLRSGRVDGRVLD